MEIYRFLPPPLLEGFDPEKVDELDEFLDLLAKARVVEDIETDIVARAIAECFADPDA